MTGMITLSDGGQNYIEFDIIDDVIQKVRPALFAGWVGTQVLNAAFFVGGRLVISLQWKDYSFPLPYPIFDILHQISEAMAWLLENMSAEPVIYVSLITKLEHLAYDVNCNGIPLYFEHKNEAAAAAAEAILKAGESLGPLMLYLDGAQLVDEDAPWDPGTIASVRDGFVTIYGNRTIDYGIIAHEVAHPWAEDRWGYKFPPEDSDYYAAIESDEPRVSEYAYQDGAEDFAESVRLYVTDRERLKAIAPLRYGVIDRMMKDPDYGG